MKKPLVGVVILNWRNAPDTLDCLESLLHTEWEPMRIVICDNGSGDGSFEKIAEYLSSHLAAGEYAVLRYKGGAYLAEGDDYDGNERVSLIDTGGNIGFAGGNNVGISYLLQQSSSPQYYWLLNNDTVVDPEAVKWLVARMDEDSRIGICGARLIYAHMPDILQAHAGASYNRWLGTGRYVGYLEPSDGEPAIEEIESAIDYVCGASMFVRDRFIEQVGLLSERYFLYFEELDWVVRGRGRFTLGYASKAKVFHKEGGTIGSSSDTRVTSWLSDYYLFLNRIRFTATHYPYALPTLYCAMAAQALRRVLRGQRDRALLIFRLLLGWRKKEQCC